MTVLKSAIPRIPESKQRERAVLQFDASKSKVANSPLSVAGKDSDYL